MHLFYSPGISTDILELPPAESIHCIKVLRLTAGDIIHLTDGKGNLYKTKIIHPDTKKCRLELIELQSEYGIRNHSLHIAVAPTKNISRFEWFLEKATEIGVDKITPIICEHSERKVVKPERLNKVIISAMKQSLKTYLPVLESPCSFKEFISYKYNEEKFIAYCSDNYRDTLKESYKKGSDAVILIGPEGDFSTTEIEQSVRSGFLPVGLGDSRLRTETAALVACFTINLLNQHEE